MRKAHPLASMASRRTELIAALVAAAAVLLAFSTPAQAWPEQWWLSAYQVTQAQAIANGSGVKVAVVDTGVVNLPDLNGQLLAGKDFTGGGNPNSDPGVGCNTAGGCYSHGTQMALLIAGTGKGAGMVGVAPGAKILAAKANPGGDEGSAQGDTVATAIRWATDNGAKVINLSLGSTGSCYAAEGDAVKYAYQHDVIVVAGTGNDGASAVSTPADCPGALAIGAVDQSNNVWPKSNTGPEVAFVNAGVNGVQETLSQQKLTQGVAGTSDATAITSGVVALLRSKYPTETARQIVTRMLYHTRTSAAAGSRLNDSFGYGIPLPYNELTKPTDLNAANPIYDGFEKALGPPTPGGSTSTTPQSPTSPSPSTSTPATGASASASSSSSATTATKSGGSSNTGLLLGGGAVVLLLILGAVALIIRGRRKPATPTGYPTYPNNPPPYPGAQSLPETGQQHQQPPGAPTLPPPPNHPRPPE